MNNSIKIASAFLMVASAFMACSSGSESNPSAPSYKVEAEQDSKHEDFILVHTTGVSSIIGSNDASAKASDRPEMEVSFTYDFSIGKHEITCGEFNKLMSNENLDGFEKLPCTNDSLPVTDVTYYDALLFANAKSKVSKEDSVYTYTGVTFDKDGHCTNLENLTFNPDKEGFRLPTEAEWVLVAKQGWSPKNSWNASNSDFKVHPICTQKTNSIGVCDMAGNAMEWVNDWFGNLKDTSLTNYAGAPDGGNLEERVVKGGHFQSEVDAINTFSRGDVYAVTSSTRAAYVGFRLAFGSIPSPTWMNSDGSASTSRIVSLISFASLKHFVGSYKAKLVFRNDLTSNLVYIDFSAGTQSFEEIKDTIPSYHPEISPNGKHVAFCTKPEGTAGSSDVYVRDLNSSGTNLIKLDVKSASIPRWRILDSGDTVITYVSSAENNKDEVNFKNASTWQVPFANGKFGTPEKLFDGAYHGGISEDNKLAVTGARLLRARLAPDKDTIWYNGEQACNAALSTDGSKRTLFLDFGGQTGIDFVGESYGVHERLLIADSAGNLIQSIAAPTNYTFDHTEWVNENLAIATVANINDAHERIVLINLKDSSTIDLVAGDELWHPDLWIGSNETIDTKLDLDSAGQYYVPGGSETAVMLRNKMEILWAYRDSKLAIIGSSRSMNGVNATQLEDSLLAINLSNVPNSMYVSSFLLRNYVLKHLKGLKYVVLSLDIDMWWKKVDESYDNFFYSEYKQLPGYVYDENHDFWEDGYPEGLLEATHNAFNIDYFAEVFTDTRGTHNEPSNSWEANPSVDYDSTWFDKNSKDYYENFNELKQMIEFAQKEDVIIIGVIFPMSPGYKKTGSFGKYGIRRSKAPALIQEINDLSKEYSNFILMDENKMGDHDYSDDMAYNRDHLGTSGAVKFTNKLDSLIKTLK